MTTIGILLLGLGLLLIWSAVKGQDPREQFLSVLSGKNEGPAQ